MKKELIVERTPKSPIAEVFRTLRTNIQFMNSKKLLKSILITSTMPGEGKTWVSSNIAITFAQAGKSVILIDADMRKGRLHNLFGTENRMGLSNYLSGIDENGREQEVDIFKYIKKTEIQNLYLISSGNVPPNPSELLASEITINMIEELKNNFDYIIFDGTPSLLVTDALIMSRLVDTTIIVTEHNSSKKEALQKVKRDIENIGGHIAGVVLNKVPVNAKKYIEKYYYSSTNTSVLADKSQSKEENFIDEKIYNKNKTTVSNERTKQILEELNQYLKK